MLGPTLHELEPFAQRARARPAKRPRSWRSKTTPIIKNEIRPFAREILPIVNELEPVARRQLGEAFPKLATSFSVLNEFFNELAYNPGPEQGGFLFFLDWGNHNLNSVRQHRRRARRRSAAASSTSTAKSLPILKGVSRNQPDRATCSSAC